MSSTVAPITNLNTSAVQPVNTVRVDFDDQNEQKATGFDDKLVKSDQQDSASATYEDDPAIKQMVMELKARDAEVRAHEQAHVAAGAGVVMSGPSYTYQQGPDGRMYAVGGHVTIDTSPEPDPEDTIRKMEKVQASALAPMDPSPSDLKIASTAAMLKQRALQELAQEDDESQLMQNLKEYQKSEPLEEPSLSSS